MLNIMILQGRLVRDPELSTTPSGIEVVKFTVAWSEKYKETESKCFLNCVAWRATAVFVNTYFKKGQEIAVQGKLTTRDYNDKDGNKRSATEVTCDQVSFCGSKSNASSGDNYSNTTATQPQTSQTAQESVASSLGDFEEIVVDGDLPF